MAGTPAIAPIDGDRAVKTVLSDMYEDSMPSLEKIRRSFPAQGEGQMEHTSLFQDQYVFDFMRTATGAYEILIRRHPPYRGRDESSHYTHRFDAGTARERICIKEEAMPRDLPTAIAMAMWWAECTSRYIRDGRPWNGGSR